MEIFVTLYSIFRFYPTFYFFIVLIFTFFIICFINIFFYSFSSLILSTYFFLNFILLILQLSNSQPFRSIPTYYYFSSYVSHFYSYYRLRIIFLLPRLSPCISTFEALPVSNDYYELIYSQSLFSLNISHQFLLSFLFSSLTY